MSDEDIKALAALVKYVIFPILGFAAGFSAQWFLQSRKSRDELLRELTPQRAIALRDLWGKTALPPEIAALNDDAVLPPDFRQTADQALLDWYTKQAGALFLSWRATQLLFRVLDVLRDKDANKRKLEDAVSSLRTRLKRDCGFYTAWDSRRHLDRPRHSPWRATRAVQGDAPPAARPSP
jgi:hypothetical protein